MWYEVILPVRALSATIIKLSSFLVPTFVFQKQKERKRDICFSLTIHPISCIIMKCFVRVGRTGLGSPVEKGNTKHLRHCQYHPWIARAGRASINFPLPPSYSKVMTDVKARCSVDSLPEFLHNTLTATRLVVVSTKQPLMCLL